MRRSRYEVEYQVGNVRMMASNLLVKDARDMTMVEFWEERLKKLGQPFTVAFRKVDGKNLYSIFTDLRRKGSAFR